MTFEKDFPSLKGMACDTRLNARRQMKRTFDEDSIKENCLDKQKVLDTINKIFPTDDIYDANNQILNFQLKQDLGLK